MDTKERCSHDPRETKGAIGMYHCPECGEMVVAGVSHPFEAEESLMDGEESWYNSHRDPRLKKWGDK